MKISEKIFEIMEEKSISQKEFSKITGIAQSVVSDWKRKGTNPSANKIMIISKALKVSPKKLLVDEEGNYYE